MDVATMCRPEDTICDTHGPHQTIRRILKRVFRRTRLICYAYELLRYLEVEIRRFSCKRQTIVVSILVPVYSHEHRAILILCTYTVVHVTLYSWLVLFVVCILLYLPSNACTVCVMVYSVFMAIHWYKYTHNYYFCRK